MPSSGLLRTIVLVAFSKQLYKAKAVIIPCPYEHKWLVGNRDFSIHCRMLLETCYMKLYVKYFY